MAGIAHDRQERHAIHNGMVGIEEQLDMYGAAGRVVTGTDGLSA